jgi:phosphoribosylformylglycinamidine cyclo-ligase
VTVGSWEVPPIFAEIQRLGGVADDEMSKVFNMGLGMIVVVPQSDLFKALDVARAAGHRAVEVGRIVAGDGTVRLV